MPRVMWRLAKGPLVAEMEQNKAFRGCAPGRQQYTYTDDRDNTFVGAAYWCQICKQDFPDCFVVHDELWAESMLEGYVCLECFEGHIGRPLALEDLKDVPANAQLMAGYKMALRDLQGDLRGGRPETDCLSST